MRAIKLSILTNFIQSLDFSSHYSINALSFSHNLDQNIYYAENDYEKVNGVDKFIDRTVADSPSKT